MNINPLFRKIMIGAAEASLDIAGSALLPGAWPIVKGALTPVLDKLKERLDGKDATSSPDLAEKAIEMFENDRHLQEIFRSNLIERLDSLAKGQQEINEDVKKLLMIVTGNEEILLEITGSVQKIEETLETGVNLSDEAIEKIRKSIVTEAENARKVRTIASKEMENVTRIMERQANRLNVHAVGLIDEGEYNMAVEELQEGLILVAMLLNEAPSDLNLRLELGFIYKTLAQVYDATGDTSESDQYIQLAETIFRSIKDEVPADRKTARNTANVIHGLANISHKRGDYISAIESYKITTTIDPEHIYAWHDMFLAYYELAKQGNVEIEAMRYALAQVKTLNTKTQNLTKRQITRLENLLIKVEGN